MEDNKSMTVKKTVKSGITFGSALAMVISYTTWKSVGWRFFMDYLVGCMSYTSFCVTKFTFVEVIKGCIMEIEYKQKISRPMNCRNCFYPYDNYSAMVRKHFL